MARGKQTCKILKEIRRQIAEANDIEFITSECRYKGDCLGTCPKCESEIHYLEQQRHARVLAGKAVALAGISVGMILMSGCSGTSTNQTTGTSDSINLLDGDMEADEIAVMKDTIMNEDGDISQAVDHARDVVRIKVEDIAIPGEVMDYNEYDEPVDTLQDGKNDSINPFDGGKKVSEIVAVKDTVVNEDGESSKTTGHTQKDVLTGEVVVEYYDEQSEPFEMIVDELPTFPGGNQKLREWVSQHMMYPQNAIDNHIEGRIVVQFVIKSDDPVANARVIRGIDKDLDKEAIRIVRLLPRFNPAMLDGKAVGYRFTLPITFELQDSYGIRTRQ